MKKDYKGAVTALEESPQGCRDLLMHPAMKQTLWELAQPEPISIPVRDLGTYGCLPQWDRSKALILHGRSFLGKSSLARSLMPTALFIRNIEDLKKFKVGVHQGIIFDDMNFMGEPGTAKGRWPRESQIHLVDYDYDSSIHGRYYNTTIPAGTPKIFTTNLSPREILAVTEQAIERRTTSWFIDGSIGALEFLVQW